MQLYLKDTSSKTGTYLNGVRLASAQTESKPFKLRDGDIIEFGMDYEGGHSPESRAILMRVNISTRKKSKDVKPVVRQGFDRYATLQR